MRGLRPHVSDPLSLVLACDLTTFSVGNHPGLSCVSTEVYSDTAIDSSSSWELASEKPHPAFLYYPYGFYLVLENPPPRKFKLGFGPYGLPPRLGYALPLCDLV